MKKNDTDIFEILFKKHQPALVQFAYSKVNSLEEAKEIVQEVFIKVWERWDNLSLDDNLKYYLFTSTKNRCLNYLKRNKQESFERIEEGHAFIIPTDNLQVLELEVIISKAIEALPGKRREVFLLSRREQLSHQQIAELLEISYKTVENQIGLALKSIKGSLARLGH